MKRSTVSQGEFSEVLEKLLKAPIIYFDTETTGLRPHHGDRLFSLIISDGEEIFYFNFQPYEDVGDEFVLNDEELFALQDLFGDSSKTFVAHNAKFDLTMLRVDGVEVRGFVHCTLAMERILDSETRPGDFGLAAVSKKYGTYKDDGVKAYIDKNKLWTEEFTPGSREKIKIKHYERVPFELMFEYACQDVESLVTIYNQQMKTLEELVKATPLGLPSIIEVYREEMELIKTVFEIECRGIRVDKDFCRRAMLNAKNDQARAEREFKELTGHQFVDSSKLYQEVFKEQKDRWVYGPVTKTGKQNPKFDAEHLQNLDGAVPAAVVAYKDARSQYNFFAGFLDACDPHGFIHTNLNQHGTTTGRFSSSNPNLQNMTKDEGEDLKKDFVVRRAIVPRPGQVFHMLDFKSMEYVVMLDYAARFMQDDRGVAKLLDKVKAGHDVHQATADIAGITRREAKTVNFALIFGSGDKLLGKNLKSTEERAKKLRNLVFNASPEIDTLIRATSQAARTRGYVVNWKGRRAKITDPRFTYRAINYLVQGGAADVVKTAMNRVEHYLRNFKTKMVLMIHDELVLDGPIEEAAEVVPAVARIMSDAFPGRYLTLSVDIEHSPASLADKEHGVAKAAGEISEAL